MSARETYLAARVLNALLREDYGGLGRRVTRDKVGVELVLASGRIVRLSPGSLYQDFVVGADESLTLNEVLATLWAVADPADEAGVLAFAEECREALASLRLHDEHSPGVLAALRDDPRESLIARETVAAFVDHPVYPTARARTGLGAGELVAYAPEFAPRFALRWAAVPRERVRQAGGADTLGVEAADVGLPPYISGTHALFPVHPLTVPALAEIPGVVVAPEARALVRPTLSMRTVELSPRTHLKLPLTTSTLGLRNRRSIKPGTLADGAAAERMLREVLAAEPGLAVSLGDEQTYAHAGHEYLGWLLRRLPEGEIVPVASLLAPSPRGGTVLAEVAASRACGDEAALVEGYLRLLMRWNVTLFVKYGVALEAHQQNLSLVYGDGPPRLLVKDNDGLLASPARLRMAGITVPSFTDERMLTDDPHALADVFVTITLHLAAAAIAFHALPHARASALVRGTLTEALDEHGDDPMARLLRARTLDAARLIGKSMVTAGTLVDKARSGARDVNKFYGTSGPNYLRRPRGGAHMDRCGPFALVPLHERRERQEPAPEGRHTPARGPGHGPGHGQGHGQGHGVSGRVS
ncbi:Siderophore synthetase component [Sinosporangium album]|uniref:Siderophore synthetase component n=1 Tax=Sinosporangium album TaxID=504805 RepID=A0A1G7YA72_9ACTN|nr:IucA/IucC family protein [Sinosporangium album]SDG93294.1 Siderophore synthetase component [Sinosporangium album]